MNPEILKLLYIIGGGAAIGIPGQMLVMRWNKKRKQQAQEFGAFPSMSQDEITAKNYIDQYKSQYPRESIKTGLLNSGIPAEKAEEYMNKYL